MAFAYEAAVPRPLPLRARFSAWLCALLGHLLLVACAICAATLVTWSAADPSLTHSAGGPVRNMLGPLGAILSDLIMQLFGLSGVFLILPPVFWALQLITRGGIEGWQFKLLLAPVAVTLLASAAAALPAPAAWPLIYGLGGFIGDKAIGALTGLLALVRPERASAAAGLFCLAGGLLVLAKSLGLSRQDLKLIFRRPQGDMFGALRKQYQKLSRNRARARAHVRRVRREPVLRMPEPHPSTRGLFAPEPRRPAAQPPAFGGDSDTTHDRISRLELAPDETSNIARRFAPARRDADAEPAEMYAERAAEAGIAAPVDPYDHVPAAAPPARPYPQHAWELKAPRPPRPSPPAPPRAYDPGFDELYGRAVAIVLRDRKASKDYLQRRLAIGYMRASDLVERMESEGILGAPVYNGVRPILIDARGSGEV